MKKSATTTMMMGLMTLAVMGTAHAEAPAPPSEAKDLSRLVGTWRGTGSMTMGSQKADGVKIQWLCKPASARWAVTCNAVMTGIPGLDKYEETDLFGYDPGAGKYHWFAVTNGAETHDHVGTPSKGPTTQFVYTGVQEGKPFREVVDMTFRGKDDATVEIRAEAFVEGKAVSLLQASVRK